MRATIISSSIFIVSLLILHSVIGFEVREIYPDERNALIELRDIVNSSLNLHANWTGPACNTKNQSRWEGVGCSDWHVTRLVLEGIQLSASLPPMLFHNLTFLNELSFRNNSLHGPLPNLANLMHLEYVFLSRNHFSGSIPSSYIDIPNLTELELQENDISGEIPPFNQQSLVSFNVSNNELQGPIPETTVLRRFTESSYANNSGLCGRDIRGLRPCPMAPAPAPAKPSRKKGNGALQPWSIGLIGVAAVLVPLCVILICLCYYLRVWKKHEEVPGGKQRWRDDSEITSGVELVFLDENWKQQQIFEVDDLLRSAAQVMGRGRLGSTYKAMLECGHVVAVKRLQELKVKSSKEFAQQMRLLGNMKHENLAEMISFYHSKEEKLIVYEYVAGGSLFSLLHENRVTVVGWKARVGMIKEIAKGLDYLHDQGHCHGNLNSSNVLINIHGNGDGIVKIKLTDYGFLPLASPHKLSVGRTPEFLQGKKLTSKADVYCFGILLLEIVTGRVPTTTTAGAGAEEEEEDLSGWVRAAVSIDWSTDILDLEIVGEKEGYDDMLRLTEIALECTDDLPDRRPSIAQLLPLLLTSF
ncbi:hypothetical protein C2S53_005559 [Perilla frutescens var. hirtella]|uniref:Protein kinase domain-containing protein n=1 Tax=Perilla frutescens var. hirtella TaxID=608512 RepID=A0AAD4PAR0_PERFH|nr:hypothetical protein C2S53_005559 [Perilla frutescens var. hirtella]